jgi:hypothetical protein
MKCIAATVAFDIPAAPDEPATMELRFTGGIDKAATRPFVPQADLTSCGFAAKVQ